MTTAARCSRELPPEIWSLILKNVPRFQMPKLLGVCSQFHDILIPIVFASIKVYFLEGQRALEVLNTDDMGWITGTTSELMYTSCEMLNHICQNPSFAKVVKSITVIGFADGLRFVERFTIANVLSFVPNLETFRWIGDGPPFDDIVAESLPKTLKGLVVQSPSFPFDSLHHITQLKSLHLSIPYFYPDGDEAYDMAVEHFDFDFTVDVQDITGIRAVLNTFSSTLQSLRLCAFQLESVPIHVFSMLHELEVFGTISDEQPGLDAMFPHATALESLTLAGLLDHMVLSFLPDYASTGVLPKLTSFRLINENSDPLQEDEFYALQKFLEGRLVLRRLHIRIPGLTLSEADTLFSINKGLQGLEILGLYTGNSSIADEEMLVRLVGSLSPNLRALHLSTTFEDEVLRQHLIDSITELPHLSFLSLCVKGMYVIGIEGVARKSKGLEMVARYRHVWNISRVGSLIRTTQWPSWRVKFCIEEDFPCADDAWLFKYS